MGRFGKEVAVEVVKKKRRRPFNLGALHESKGSAVENKEVDHVIDLVKKNKQQLEEEKARAESAKIEEDIKKAEEEAKKATEEESKKDTDAVTPKPVVTSEVSKKFLATC